MPFKQINIGVAGAGVMGSGIAQVLAVAGHEVICTDLEEKVLNLAKENIEIGRFGLEGSVERGKLTEEEARLALNRVKFSTEQRLLNEVDLVIEAIPERLDLKVAFWKDLDKNARKSTIFASNSSGFSVSGMAAATNRPERFIGWHWASPAPVMKLAEIVKGSKTSEETVDLVVALAKTAGKNPIVISDSDTHWGYATNRIYFAMVREALSVVNEGIATREDVDQLMTDSFRWPSGPFGMTRGATSGWK